MPNLNIPSNLAKSDGGEINWSNPDTSLLKSSDDDRPIFPAELLGAFWTPFVEALAKSKNTPVDYVGASLITVAAALIGNARIAVGPAWKEPPVLWTCLVGQSSSGKSPALDPFVEIVSDFETEASFDSGDHGPGDGTFYIDDVTAEAAAQLASLSGRGLFLIKDELHQWWRGLGRHEGFWNSAYGARLAKVQRKDRRTIKIERLAISILGGAQPKTLTKHIRSPENTGFAGRWLYVFPAPVEGYRAAPAVNLDPARSKLNRLWTLFVDDEGPVAVSLGTQAVSKFERWVDAKKRAANEDQGGVWGQWLGKQGGVALRLALVFEHLWWVAQPGAEGSPPTRISVPALNAAIRFIDSYSSPMAALTLGDAVRPSDEQDARHLLRMLAKNGEGRFNARALGRSSGAGPLADPEAMKAACKVLVEANLVRHIGKRVDGRPGKPPSLYEVNPAVLGLVAKGTTRRGVQA